ncbi:MAG: L,D-transpeptidase family protein, partial [Chloroflexi bacterium]|nr:L,D-transpeptidase family protein [Chloroflexota bacterium]
PVNIDVPSDGDWFIHLRAADGAGNLSAVDTLPVHVDTTVIKLDPPSFDTTSFNPVTGPVAIDVKASKATSLRLDILPEKSATPVRSLDLGVNSQAKAQWDGKDAAGQLAPPGSYRLLLHAQDKTGRTAEILAQDPLPVTNKRIVVSLGQQRLWAYEGDKVIVDSLITSGGPDLPTPTGTFHVLEKRYHFTFKSPWPKTSPYWYPDSPTTYALLFEDSGYFIHDAPWRGWFGPGSNANFGRPGDATTGTHGCINAPYGIAQAVYNWADVGTPVIIGN